jgi:hypothetical protein
MLLHHALYDTFLCFLNHALQPRSAISDSKVFGLYYGSNYNDSANKAKKHANYRMLNLGSAIIAKKEAKASAKAYLPYPTSPKYLATTKTNIKANNLVITSLTVKDRVFLAIVLTVLMI